jgi:hypothetical protein
MTLRRLALSPRPGALWRGIIAGGTWGIVTGLLVITTGAWDCGFICLPDAALTMATSVVAGLATIGPLAAFGARADRHTVRIGSRAFGARPQPPAATIAPRGCAIS